MKVWASIIIALRPKTKQQERMRRLESNDAKIDELHDRVDRILNENHLGPAIKRALEGR